MIIQPIIYTAKLSKQSVTTKEKIDITLVVGEVETFYPEVKYAKSSDAELISGQEIGVI